MRLGNGVYIRTPGTHFGPVRFHPHIGHGHRRRPPRTDRVRRVSLRRHTIRRALLWSVVIVPAAIVTAVSLASALAALAVVAVALGRWKAYRDLLDAIRASTSAIYEIHFATPTPDNPECE